MRRPEEVTRGESDCILVVRGSESGRPGDNPVFKSGGARLWENDDKTTISKGSQAYYKVTPEFSET